MAEYDEEGTFASTHSPATFMEDTRVIKIYSKAIRNFEFVDFKYKDRQLSQHVVWTTVSTFGTKLVETLRKEAHALFKLTHKSTRTTCTHQLPVTT